MKSINKEDNHKYKIIVNARISSSRNKGLVEIRISSSFPGRLVSLKVCTRRKHSPSRSRHDKRLR